MHRMVSLCTAGGAVLAVVLAGVAQPQAFATGDDLCWPGGTDSR
ncbi:hypothetical protein [Streptomyces sp. NPDC058412]